MHSTSAWFEKGKPTALTEDLVSWLVTPPDMRAPSTQKAWAEAHGVPWETMRSYIRDERVKRLVSRASDKLNMSPERVQEVMDALFNRAKGGDTQAAKLYMEQVERIRKLQDDEPQGYESMDDAELEALARELAARS